MKKIFAGLVLALTAFAAHALQPYVLGNKVAGGDLKAVTSAVEQKLTTSGFAVIGLRSPKGLPDQATVVVTEPALTEVLSSLGGTDIVAIPIRVGVKADGTVSYVNLEYWQRAYLRGDYAKAESAVKAAAAKLAQALGAGAAFGGDIPAADLARYHYMFGMERFDEKTELVEHKTFEDAVKTVRDNLAKGVRGTSKAYELIFPDKKFAVFGVTMDDPDLGEGWWMNKIGADNVAALPWEIFVLDGKVMALFGRYRTALAWPSLGMGQFMTISNHPDATRAILADVAGAR